MAHPCPFVFNKGECFVDRRSRQPLSDEWFFQISSLIIRDSCLDPYLIHCMQEYLDFLLAHSNPENRVSAKRNG